MESAITSPLYSTAFTARLAGVSKDRVRRWLRGYDYVLDATPSAMPQRRHQEPVVRQEGQREGAFASFLDLVDLLFVKKFLDHGLSLQKIRRALDEAEEILGERHFSRRRFFTNGRNIFLEIQDRGEAILELGSGGQWAIPQIILQLSSQIEFDPESEFALRWYPEWGHRKVVVDPCLSYGRPVLVGKAIPTSVLYDQVVGEGGDSDRVATWFDIQLSDVKAAVDFETRLARVA